MNLASRSRLERAEMSKLSRKLEKLNRINTQLAKESTKILTGTTHHSKYWNDQNYELTSMNYNFDYTFDVNMHTAGYIESKA